MPTKLPTKATHKVRRGETLSAIATRYYGLASYWVFIYEANKAAIGKDPHKLETGVELQIPEVPAQPAPPPGSRNDHLVRIDIAKLEGRKLLQQPAIMLNGVSDSAAKALAEELKIVSIFDLAVARIFNGARDLAEASGVLAKEYSKYNFVPGDLIRGDPTRIHDLAALLRADIEELNFHNQDDAANRTTAKRLRDALSVRSVRDLALWPPFLAARQILEGTFNPYQLADDDPEAPSDLLPKTGNFATERVYYTNFVITDMDSGDEKEDLGEAGPVDLMSGPLDEGGFRQPAVGAMILTEQAWYAQGVTLGQLLHSLSLAPGESTKIAVVDWTRRTAARSEQATSQIEQLSQITDQARSISEITNALARETQHGSSLSSSMSGSTQAGVSGGFLGLFGGSAGGSTSSGIATSATRSSGSRRIAAKTAQNIQASTQQHATSARSRRAAIVQETFEAEHEATTTRVVTNYNHMHALSLQYYEVVQVYRVKTRPVDYERVLYIPMQPFNFNDPRVITRHRQVLAMVAPDKQHRDEILAWTPPVSHSRMKAENARTVARGLPEGWEPLHDAAVDIDKFPSWIWDQATGGRLERIEYRCHGAGELAAIHIEPRYGDEAIRKPIGEEEAQVGEVEFAHLTLDSISRIELVFPEAADKRGNVTLVYHLRFDEAGRPGAILRQYVTAPPTNGEAGAVRRPVASITTAATAGSSLIDHLNENALHYSQAIWLTADPLALSRVLAGYRYEGRSCVAALDLRPVVMTGNYLGFLWHFEDEAEREAWLEDKGFTESESNGVEAMVPLPSGGVFAEAVLGRFNAAEKLDLSRFWNWQDSPIPILPPDIKPVETGSRARDPNLKIDGLEAQAVHITQPPGLPDPSGLQATLQSLTASNIFRDMSGIAATSSLAQTGLQAASKGAGDASKDAVEAYKTAAEHHRAMTKMAMEAGAQLLPLVAGPAGAAGLAGSSLSKAGAVMNMAQKLDAGADGGGGSGAGAGSSGDGGGQTLAAFRSLIGRLAGLAGKGAGAAK